MFLDKRVDLDVYENDGCIADSMKKSLISCIFRAKI